MTQEQIPETGHRNQVEEVAALAQRMSAEIRKAFVGQDEVVHQVLVALFAAGHVLIEGVPGLGKTLLVRSLAKSFNGQHGRIQFTPDLMPSDVIGHLLYDRQSSEFKIRRGPIFTQLLLADEINRAPAKTQSALLEAMQERQVTLEGKPLGLPSPFMTLATQNPVEQEGTYPLPEAEVDRFLLKILIDYPNEASEQAMVTKVIGNKVGDMLDLSEVQPIQDSQSILSIQQLCARQQIDKKVLDYAITIVRHTREWQGIAMGAGPRGSLALIRAARANALIAGRDFVTPDDVKTMAAPALRHRITLSPDMEIEGMTSDQLLKAILNHVEAPRL